MEKGYISYSGPEAHFYRRIYRPAPTDRDHLDRLELYIDYIKTKVKARTALGIVEILVYL